MSHWIHWCWWRFEGLDPGHHHPHHFWRDLRGALLNNSCSVSDSVTFTAPSPSDRSYVQGPDLLSQALYSFLLKKRMQYHKCLRGKSAFLLSVTSPPFSPIIECDLLEQPQTLFFLPHDTSYEPVCCQYISAWSVSWWSGLLIQTLRLGEPLHIWNWI